MAADGTTFPPFQTIPELTPVASLKFTAQVWVSQDGKDWRANIGDIAAVMPPHVTSFNGRTGDVGLTIGDITQAGGAPNSSPVLVGVPQAPTPPRGADDTRIATAEFVQDALSSSVVGVASWNGRVGEVVLTTPDITGAGGATAAQLANYLPLTGGVLSGPGNLQVQGALNAQGGIIGSGAVLSGDLSIGATKAANTVWAGPASGPAAAPTWRRLSAADITGLPVGTVTSVGLTAPGDLIVTGSPVTGAGTINLTRASQPSSTVLAAPNGVPGVPSYRALVQSDIVGGVGVTSVGLTAPTMFTVSGSPITGSGSLGLALAPQPNNFVLAGPTAGGPLTPTFRQLTAADITGLPVGSVTSVGLAMPAEFTVAGSPVTGAGTLTVTKASQTANFVYAAPNGAAGAPTFRALTQADISNGVGVTSVALSMPTMFNVSGGPITGAGTFNVTLAPVGNNLVFAGPTTGGPLAPAFRALQQSDITGGVGVTSLGLTMPADFGVANSPVTGAGTLIVTRNSQAAGLFMASPAGAAGVPSYRALALSDLPAGVGTVTSVGLTAPAGFTVSGSPVTGSGALALGLAPQNANLVWAGPTSGGAAAPTFRALTAADIPSLSATYLPLTGGTLTGPLNGTSAVFSGTVTNAGETVNGNLSVSGTATANQAALNGAAGTFRTLVYQSAGLARWNVYTDNTAESGSNAGSNFDISRYTDAGALIDTPLTINRATGLTTILDGALVNGGLTAAGGGPIGALGLDGPAGTVRQFNITTAGSTRWRLTASSAPESGGNAGSDLNLQRFSDTGTSLGTVLSVLRSTGVVSLLSGLTLPTSTANGVLVGQAGNGPLTSVAPGTAGQVLTSRGVGVDPIFGGNALIGSAAGNLAAPAPASTNIQLYFNSSTNWAGIMAGTAGDIGFVAGTTAPSTKFVIGQDGGLYGPQSVTGGDMGAGTLNIPGPIYLNGAQIKTSNLADRDAGFTAWTPTVAVTTLGDGVFSGVSASGNYRRLGFLVWFNVQIGVTLTFTTASGNLLFQGLPFSNAGGLDLCPMAMNPMPAAPYSMLVGQVTGTTVSLYITGSNYIGNAFGPSYGMVSGTAYVIRVSGIYCTNAP